MAPNLKEVFFRSCRWSEAEQDLPREVSETNGNFEANWSWRSKPEQIAEWKLLGIADFSI